MLCRHTDVVCHSHHCLSADVFCHATLSINKPICFDMLLDMPSEKHRQLIPHILLNGLAAPAPHLKTFSLHLLAQLENLP